MSMGIGKMGSNNSWKIKLIKDRDSKVIKIEYASPIIV